MQSYIYNYVNHLSGRRWCIIFYIGLPDYSDPKFPRFRINHIRSLTCLRRALLWAWPHWPCITVSAVQSAKVYRLVYMCHCAGMLRTQWWKTLEASKSCQVTIQQGTEPRKSVTTEQHQQEGTGGNGRRGRACGRAWRQPGGSPLSPSEGRHAAAGQEAKTELLCLFIMKHHPGHEQRHGKGYRSI